MNSNTPAMTVFSAGNFGLGQFVPGEYYKLGEFEPDMVTSAFVDRSKQRGAMYLHPSGGELEVDLQKLGWKPQPLENPLVVPEHARMRIYFIRKQEASRKAPLGVKYRILMIPDSRPAYRLGFLASISRQFLLPHDQEQQQQLLRLTTDAQRSINEEDAAAAAELFEPTVYLKLGGSAYSFLEFVPSDTLYTRFNLPWEGIVDWASQKHPMLPPIRRVTVLGEAAAAATTLRLLEDIQTRTGATATPRQAQRPVPEFKLGDKIILMDETMGAGRFSCISVTSDRLLRYEIYGDSPMIT